MLSFHSTLDAPHYKTHLMEKRYAGTSFVKKPVTIAVAKNEVVG